MAHYHHYEEIGKVKHYEWQLRVGQQWQPIDNDHVIEAHYCHPGAKGISLNTTQGRLHIDLDTLQTDDPAVALQRLSFAAPEETEAMGWYYRDDSLWREYGTSDALTSRPLNLSSSITSDVIEQHFTKNPQGTLRFSVGSVGYSLDFPTMVQTNLVTGMRRNVRRRPKFKDISGGIQPSSSSLAPPGGHRWEFMGDEGVWTEYQAHVCSYDSAAIERLYQQDPGGQLHFAVNRQSYTLDFAGMFQVNDFYGTMRHVRRTPLDSQTPRWQFQDIDGQWKDYTKVSRQCSVSSEEIELEYQQNPSGSVSFSTTSYRYELDFTAMTQTNLSTNKSRPVRRVSK